MATVVGILGQSAPSAATLTDVYTVPSSKNATIKIVALNRGGADVFRIAVSPNGAAIANAHYIAYDEEIEANKSLSSEAITVGDTDVVRVYSNAGSMSFTVSGIEEDN